MIRFAAGMNAVAAGLGTSGLAAAQYLVNETKAERFHPDELEETE